MFARLKLYTVFSKTDASGELEDVRFVRDGFSFLAFLLNVFWALYHRLWWLAAVCLGVLVGTELLVRSGWLSVFSVGVIQVGAFIIVGMWANDCLRASLKKRGYDDEDVVSGETKIRAQQRFFDRMDRPAYL